MFCLSSHRLEGTEEKFRNRESRPEDLQIIAELKDMVSERESLVKKLVVCSAAVVICAQTVLHSQTEPFSGHWSDICVWGGSTVVRVS